MLPAIERRKPPPIALLREQSLRIAITPNRALMMGRLDLSVAVKHFALAPNRHHCAVKRRFGLWV